MYLTYSEYTNLGGQLSVAEFDRFCFRAQKEIDNATLNRCKTLETIPEDVKKCQIELIQYLSNNAKNGNVSAISSFGNDGYSVSYSEQKSAQRQIYDIIYTYLSGTDLMYCGVG